MLKKTLSVLLCALMLLSFLTTTSFANYDDADDLVTLPEMTGMMKEVVPVTSDRLPEDAPYTPMRSRTVIQRPPEPENSYLYDQLSLPRQKLYYFFLTLAFNKLCGEGYYLWDYRTEPDPVSDKYYSVAQVCGIQEDVTAEDVQLVFEIFYRNEPEYFWLANSFLCTEYTDDTVAYVGIFSYYYTVPFYHQGVPMTYGNYDNEVISDMQLEIDTVLESPLNTAAGYTDKQAVRYIYDWIITRGTYRRYDFTNQDECVANRDAHSIYGIVSSKLSAVCEGYAKLFNYMLSRCGIEVYIVSGYSQSSLHEITDAILHAWSIVRLDGKWYEFDVTWDDIESAGKQYYFYFFFAIETEVMNRFSHMRSVVDPATLAPTPYVTLLPVAESISIANEFIIDYSLDFRDDPNKTEKYLYRYKGPGGILYLPEGYVGISKNAIVNQTTNNNMHPVVICVVPEGVTDIENVAFKRCNRLEAIYLPSTLDSSGLNGDEFYYDYGTPALRRIYGLKNSYAETYASVYNSLYGAACLFRPMGDADNDAVLTALDAVIIAEAIADGLTPAELFAGDASLSAVLEGGDMTTVLSRIWD